MSAVSKNISGNVCYLQSGGPTAVINATFQGLFDAYCKSKNKGDFYVSPYGISGLLNGKLKKVTKDELPPLDYRPGSYFGSLRKKLSSDPESEEAKKLIKALKKFEIKYLFVNGGNDSMHTAFRISEYAKWASLDIKVIGIPKTIDNDLYGCDHTPGFGTAAKYVANAVIATSIDDKTYQKGRVNIIETMGRDSGFVAASAILASLRGEKPDYIFVPEVPFSIPEFLEKVKSTYAKKGRCLVVVSEGIRDKDGILIATDSSVKDSFNNQQVGGVGKYLSSLVAMEGIKTRGIELSVLNRSSGFLPSLTDINEAKEVSHQAYLTAVSGISGMMIAIRRGAGEEYYPEYVTIPLMDVADKFVTLPKKYINKSGDNINSNYIKFVAPLVMGNAIALGEDGLLKL